MYTPHDTVVTSDSYNSEHSENYEMNLTLTVKPWNFLQNGIQNFCNLVRPFLRNCVKLGSHWAIRSDRKWGKLFFKFLVETCFRFLSLSIAHYRQKEKMKKFSYFYRFLSFLFWEVIAFYRFLSPSGNQALESQIFNTKKKKLALTNKRENRIFNILHWNIKNPEKEKKMFCFEKYKNLINFERIQRILQNIYAKNSWRMCFVVKHVYRQRQTNQHTNVHCKHSLDIPTSFAKKKFRVRKKHNCPTVTLWQVLCHFLTLVWPSSSVFE